MKKIKWLNVFKMIILLLCIGMIVHDIFMLTIYSYISGAVYGWSWFGFISFCLVVGVMFYVIDDFKEQIKKMSTDSAKDSRHLK